MTWSSGSWNAAAALRLEDADDPERDAADGDLRADVGRAESQVGGRGRAEDGDAQVASTLTSVRNVPCQTS